MRLRSSWSEEYTRTLVFLRHQHKLSVPVAPTVRSHHLQPFSSHSHASPLTALQVGWVDIPPALIQRAGACAQNVRQHFACCVELLQPLFPQLIHARANLLLAPKVLRLLPLSNQITINYDKYNLDLCNIVPVQSSLKWSNFLHAASQSKNSFYLTNFSSYLQYCRFHATVTWMLTLLAKYDHSDK
jgi:hypothetical protein